MQVVHDHQVQALIVFQAAGLGAHLHHGGRGGIVNPHRGLGQLVQAVGHALAVLAVQMAGAEFVRVDIGVGGEQAHQQRFLGHFQAEDGHAMSGHGHALGDVQRQRGFAHGGPRRQDNQLGGLEAGGHVVKRVIAGGQAGDGAAFGDQAVQPLVVFLHQLLDGDEALADAVFSQAEDFGFRRVEHFVRVQLRFERALLDGMRGLDEVAQDGFLFDDARVVADVGDARHAVHERGEIGRASGGFQLALAAQLFGEREQVDGLAGRAELDHAVEDAPVVIREKVFAAQGFQRRGQALVIEQNGAQDAALGFERGGQRAFDGDVGGHESIDPM